MVLQVAQQLTVNCTIRAAGQGVCKGCHSCPKGAWTVLQGTSNPEVCRSAQVSGARQIMTNALGLRQSRGLGCRPTSQLLGV